MLILSSNLGSQRSTGAVTLITTADTTISNSLLNTATTYRTIFCDAVVWELLGDDPPFTSQLIVAPAVLLNPEVELTIYPVTNPSCASFGPSIALISSNGPVPEIPGDTDPIRLEIDGD